MLSRFQSVLFSAFEGATNSIIKVSSRFQVLKRIPGAIALFNAAFYVLNELAWLLPSKTTIEIQDSKMYVNVHDKDPAMRKTFRSYSRRRVHEKSTTDLFKKVVKEGDCVVDLGANIGYFTLLSAKLVGKKGKVYAFEPEPRNYSYLLKNIELNGYDNVVAMQKAVSDKIAKTKLFICPYDTGHHTIHQYDGIQAYRPDFVDKKKDFVEVEMTTLDDFFKEQPINVMKMDIEGAESLALLGMDRVIRENPGLKMFIEFFPLLIKKMGNSPEGFISRLLEYNFSIFIVPGDYTMQDHTNPDYGKLHKVNSIDELMNLCSGQKDHVNLFLKRAENSDLPL